MDARSTVDSKEKMKRSDKCSKTCKFKDDSTNKCVFETCLLEEIPPTQISSMQVQCIICGTKYKVPVMTTLTEDRVCTSCRTTLKKWIDNCDAVLTHIKHPI
jgi:hypothetical protein